MVRRSPDDIVNALSKNLKQKDAPTLRITFKRGGIWQPEFAKAHSRKAKQALKAQVKAEAGIDEEKEWPLLARFRQNEKDEDGKVRVRRSCLTK